MYPGGMRATRSFIVACWLVAGCTARNPAFRDLRPDAAMEEERADASATPPISPADAEAALDLAPGPVDADEPDLAIAPDLAAAPDLATAPDLTTPDLAPAFPPPGCGTGTANITGIENADGVVVDTDGTVYFLTDDATSSYVGRIEPGKQPVRKWLEVVDSPVTWGLALDSPNHRLYVVVVSGLGALVAFDDIKGTPKGKAVVTGISNPNDAVVAADGTVYYSVQGDRQIHWYKPDGRTGTTTRTPLGNTAQQQAPSALAIDPAGNLIVGLEHGGPLWRIVLNGASELSRDMYGTWTGWANGLTFDRQGRLHISIYDDAAPREVVRIEPDGKPKTLASGGRFSSIAFGRGPLDCRDLYIAEPFGPMRKVRIDDALD
jgi:sugar lactone lactonase YvrE